MKIALEAPFRVGGHSTMADVVVPAWLDALAALDRENEYLVFGVAARRAAERERQLHLPPSAPNFSRFVVRFSQGWAEPAAALGLDVIGRALRKRGVTFLHALEPLYPTPSDFPTLQSVYDLIPDIYPQWSPPEMAGVVARRRERMKRALHSIAISECTKRDMVRVWGMKPEDITVVYMGVDRKAYRRVEDPGRLTEIKRRFDLPERFILSTGAFDVKKNLERQIEAYAAVRAKLPDVGLVLVGGHNAYEEKLKAVSARLRVPVRFVGAVSREDLLSLYSLAALFAFAGLYEGQGLPSLEAMACGCPLVSSNVSAYPEVVGDAGILVNPEDVSAIAGAFESVLTQPALAAGLRARGDHRASLFSWERAARETLGVYRKLAAALTAK